MSDHLLTLNSILERIAIMQERDEQEFNNMKDKLQAMQKRLVDMLNAGLLFVCHILI